ncbi:glycosyltransferase [Candidatus Symbiobacter mobilis]|nr:glycosyltransferase [Candidatus Symbiobacter mobilis]
MDIFIDLAERLQPRKDVGFLFVGRGSEARRLQKETVRRRLNNVLFQDEIEPDEIPALYAQCCAGIVALDPKHKTHNIPGKFLTYMQSGLPVLANVNHGNDLVTLIRKEDIGKVCETHSVDMLETLALALLDKLDQDTECAELQNRCRKLFEKEFAVERAVRQIVLALGG